MAVGKSIWYGGHDFSATTSCEVIEGPQVLKADTLKVPGRAGALLLGGDVEPRVIVVRLFLDPKYLPGVTGLSDMRHGLYAWLVAPSGNVLVLPGDPKLTFKDAVVTAVEGWDTLFEDGKCKVEFTCYDPIAYGESREVDESDFEVGGTWRTWPTITCVASAGTSLMVTDSNSGSYVLLTHDFDGGEVVVLDFLAETASVDAVDASADVDMASDFFALEPGDCSLEFVGCESFEVAFCERWV